MDAAACAAFLAWALPELGLRPSGFRRVRRQVCKRLARRLAALGLADATAYRRYLAAHPDEWCRLDACCRITISRFYRDQAVFDVLAETVLPALTLAAAASGRAVVRVWSAGCASGEEPYSVAIAWRERLASRFPAIGLEIVATDADPGLLERAARASYRPGSLRELPEAWRSDAFAVDGALRTLRPWFRENVRFVCQDVREAAPGGQFDLVLCRNVAFTYFDEAGQRSVLARLLGALRPAGALVIGRRERLPGGDWPLEPWLPRLGVFRRVAPASRAPCPECRGSAP